MAYYGLSGSGKESPGLSPYSHSSWALSWCFTSTETTWLIMDWVGQERTAQAYLPIRTAPELFRGASRPQKPYGLSGTGKEWARKWEPRPTSLFTSSQVLKVSLPDVCMLTSWGSPQGNHPSPSKINTRFKTLLTLRSQKERALLWLIIITLCTFSTLFYVQHQSIIINGIIIS